MARKSSKKPVWRYWLGEAINGFAPFVGGGISDLSQPVGLKSHFHSGYEFTYVDRGEVTWAVEGGRELTLRGGDMAVTMPGILHKGKYEIIQPCHLFWVIFETETSNAEPSVFTQSELDIFDKVLQTAGNSVAKARPFMHSIFGQLLQIASTKNARTELGAANIRSLVSTMLTECVQSISDASSLKPFNRFESALEHIKTNLENNISIGDLAELSGLGRSRFFEAFRKQTGLTPSDYIMRERCSRARELLLSTTKSVTEIALDLGFSSSQYFATCFRKFAGKSPAQFRKTGR